MTTDISSPPDLDGTPFANSVHTKETTPTDRTPHTYRVRCLSHCLPEYIHVERALRLSDAPRHIAQLKRLSECRNAAWFVQHEGTLEVRVVASTCKVRWCPMCQRTRRSIIVPGIAHYVETTSQPKFLTLTLKHSNRPLADQVQHLYKAFTRLRATKFWKDRVFGGVWFFQVTRSKSSRQWHPHLHVLVDANWLPHAELRRHWDYITGGSHIVDIRLVRDPDKTADYVARYATCPCNVRNLCDADKLEVVTTFDDRRLSGTFGSAKGIPLRPKKQADWFKWRYVVGYYGATLHAAAEPALKALLKAWHTGRPCPVTLYRRDSDPDFDKTLPREVSESYHQLWFEWFSDPPPLESL